MGGKIRMTAGKKEINIVIRPPQFDAFVTKQVRIYDALVVLSVLETHMVSLTEHRSEQ
jgi:hypothetical protein